MQRQSFWRLYARFVSFRRAFQHRSSGPGDLTATSASPILTFTAAALFLILVILEIDLHRDALRALGLVFGDEGEPIFAGP